MNIKQMEMSIASSVLKQVEYNLVNNIANI